MNVQHALDLPAPVFNTWLSFTSALPTELAQFPVGANNLVQVPEGGANRQRTGVRQPGIHGLGASAWHPPHPDQAGVPNAKRLHREFQWQFS